jgi:cytochrome c553
VFAGLFLIGCNDQVKQEPQAKKETQSQTKTSQTEQKPTGIKSTVVPTRTVTAKSLYAKCASCHGADASKKALGKSKVIKGWSVERLTQAMEGYKNGTYGGEMKTMMKGQVQNLNAVDINILSNYISKL